MGLSLTCVVLASREAEVCVAGQLFGLEVAQQALFAKPKDEPDVWNGVASFSLSLSSARLRALALSA
eukprot:3210041-Rhodomonas_salina.1